MTQHPMVQKFRAWILAALGIVIGVLLVGALAHESPWNLLCILYRSAFGSAYDLGMTLFYTTPLIFTGLAVAVPLRAGLFNIGAEGQLLMGSMAAAAAGIWLKDWDSEWVGWICILAAMVGGGFWGGLAGWIRVKRHAHEVIVTILMNFIAAGMTSYWTLYVFTNPDTQNPETKAIGPASRFDLWTFFEGAPLSAALVLAVVLACVLEYFFNRHPLGFEIQAVGENEVASKISGRIPTNRVMLLSMLMGGALAGWVAVPQVLGQAGKFQIGFSPGYGFLGIAVALLAKGRPVGILFSALLFGALTKGSLDLDLETETVTRDVSMVLQALVIWIASSRLMEKRMRVRA